MPPEGWKNLDNNLIVSPKFDDRGLIPAIVQNAQTRQVLTLAYMNAESLRLTQQTGETHFWSRSRQELWHKGATSGNIQKVVEMTLDCDLDALLVRVIPAGPACHTGAVSCFFNPLPLTVSPTQIGEENHED
ncbi:phosphoribosyl-AMP cyclohydrolase [Ornatilinea apprima]|uniref:Phosphoribosyl-AMP cyclohydrolase n=1 Tax=Ornatilinea apprima TaxID=1134406 RepID=A0A0P6XA51_9CHLR|nr:phosphoribosyl-AMP cyclohydrolase [Ornatilinea apprima]KPL71470.1 phosphoribosyl-AMP cyclohydrolase [Ornatilinea apprima]